MMSTNELSDIDDFIAEPPPWEDFIRWSPESEVPLSAAMMPPRSDSMASINTASSTSSGVSTASSSSFSLYLASPDGIQMGELNTQSELDTLEESSATIRQSQDLPGGLQEDMMMTPEHNTDTYPLYSLFGSESSIPADPYVQENGEPAYEDPSLFYIDKDSPILHEPAEEPPSDKRPYVPKTYHLARILCPDSTDISQALSCGELVPLNGPTPFVRRKFDSEILNTAAKRERTWINVYLTESNLDQAVADISECIEEGNKKPPASRETMRRVLRTALIPPVNWPRRLRLITRWFGDESVDDDPDESNFLPLPMRVSPYGVIQILVRTTCGKDVVPDASEYESEHFPNLRRLMTCALLRNYQSQSAGDLQYCKVSNDTRNYGFMLSDAMKFAYALWKVVEKMPGSQPELAELERMQAPPAALATEIKNTLALKGTKKEKSAVDEDTGKNKKTTESESSLIHTMALQIIKKENVRLHDLIGYDELKEFADVWEKRVKQQTYPDFTAVKKMSEKKGATKSSSVNARATGRVTKKRSFSQRDHSEGSLTETMVST